jgi:hypothetical protein
MTNATKGMLYTAAVLLLGFGLGIGAGWKLYHPTPSVIADHGHNEQILPGGGVVVQEAPTSEVLPAPTGMPKTVVVVRRVEVLVKPDCPPVAPLKVGDPILPEPKPMRIIMSLIRQQDSTLRVVATVEGGTIVGALDIPSDSQPIAVVAAPPRVTRWAVQVERIIPVDRMIAPAWGAAVQYARGPFVGSIGANRYEIRVGAGFRF